MRLPETMTAIEIAAPGAPEVLRPAIRPVPAPGAGEVLIQVAAAGVNRPDVLQRKGAYPPPPGASDIPGLEVAGTVIALGPDTAGPAPGTAVTALVSGGGYAAYCTAPAVQCLPVPQGLDMVQAAALPETVFTVWTNLFDRGRLRDGDWVLLHGGSSGIGTTAIQLAHAYGARVIVTAGSAAKCEACLGLGAGHAVNYREQDFVEAVQSITGGRGVDVVLDMVGGDYFARNIACLAQDGRLVQIAFLKTSRVEVDIQAVMRRRLTVTGSTLRPRSVAEKGEIARAVQEHVWPLIEAGRFRPVIHATFPLARAADAHRLMESSGHIGKIVLTAG